MFQAVRDWVGDRHWRRPARLFAFEFLVVVAGVLAAQALQNWAAQRSDRAAGVALLDNARDNVAELGSTISFWAEYGPCLRDHVRRIASVTASGGTLNEEQIGRPALPAVPITSWTEEGRQQASLAMSQADLGNLFWLNVAAEDVSEAEHEIGREWASLRLIDPTMGKALAEDRSRVRQAAVAIDNRIGFLLYTRNQASLLASELGIAMPTTTTPTVRSLVNRCGLLKEWR